MKISHRLGIGFTILLCLVGAHGLYQLHPVGTLSGATVLSGGIVAWLVWIIGRTRSTLREAVEQRDYLHQKVIAMLDESNRAITRNASDAAEAATLTLEEAGSGCALVRQSASKMERVADVISESAGSVDDVGISSRELAKIVCVIGDVADQTNLLALNAAIEAARAGDHGRGFGVVADEVRKLAERTTQSAKQADAIVEAIQTNVARAVTTLQSGSTDVTDGIELADQAGKALDDIVRHAVVMQNLIDQIVANSNAQSATGEQISRHLHHDSPAYADRSSMNSAASHDLPASTPELQRRMAPPSYSNFGNGNAAHRPNGLLNLTLGGDGAPQFGGRHSRTIPSSKHDVLDESPDREQRADPS